MGNGSVGAGDGDRRRVGGAGGKNLRSIASRNSLSYGLDICRVAGAGKQGRKLKVGIAGLVGVENVSGVANFPSVSSVFSRVCCGGSNMFVEGVVA